MSAHVLLNLLNEMGKMKSHFWRKNVKNLPFVMLLWMSFHSVMIWIHTV